MRVGRIVPWGLILLPALGCPLIVAGAIRGWSGAWLSAIVVAALLSDIYDGVLARRWGSDTSAMRLCDSLADTVFYLGVLWALWLREPQVLRGNAASFAVLFSLEGLRYVFDLSKFGKAASYHSYLAKAWGVVIAIAVVGSLIKATLGPLIGLAVVFGIVVNLEGLGMSLLLPRWKNDVKTLREAWMLRQKMLSHREP